MRNYSSKVKRPKTSLQANKNLVEREKIRFMKKLIKKIYLIINNKIILMIKII